MATTPRTKRPGDVLLDRYMPNASPEEREEARKNLYEFVGALAAIAQRHASDEWERKYGIRAKSAAGVE